MRKFFIPTLLVIVYLLMIASISRCEEVYTYDSEMSPEAFLSWELSAQPKILEHTPIGAVVVVKLSNPDKDADIKEVVLLQLYYMNKYPKIKGYAYVKNGILYKFLLQGSHYQQMLPFDAPKTDV